MKALSRAQSLHVYEEGGREGGGDGGRLPGFPQWSLSLGKETCAETHEAARVDQTAAVLPGGARAITHQVAPVWIIIHVFTIISVITIIIITFNTTIIISIFIIRCEGTRASGSTVTAGESWSNAVWQDASVNSSCRSWTVSSGITDGPPGL